MLFICKLNVNLSLSLDFLPKSLAPPTKISRVAKRVVKLIGFQSCIMLTLRRVYILSGSLPLWWKNMVLFMKYILFRWHQISEDVKVNFSFWLQLHSLSISFIANALPVFSSLWKSQLTSFTFEMYTYILCTLSIMLSLLLAFKNSSI